MKYLVLLCTISSLCFAQTNKFPTNKCSLPFNEAPTTNLFIDKHCGIAGKPENAAGDKQNRQKNNLCSTSDETLLTTSDFGDLQSAIDADGLVYGNPHAGRPGPPNTRAPFTKQRTVGSGVTVGEGSHVYMAGYLIESHYSPKPNSDSGESSNCNSIFPTRVDIHVSLSETPDYVHKTDDTATKHEKLCKSISAEVIPHLRPSFWSNEWLESVTGLQRPVRISGQLMFDASHEPCKNGEPKKGDPARLSSWEIHPIYTIDVCKKKQLSACDPNNDSDWQAISEVSDLPEPEFEYED